jgi:2,3-bisphosphoglycerate-dependent phosphoglycerate mutase
VKEEMKKKLGEEQFMKIRRGWDIRPPSLDKNSEYSSLIRKNPLYKDIKNIPDTESLKDTYNRAVPYFEKEILIYLKQNKNVILSAHGNSIRAIGKKIFNISDEKIPSLEIPTGNPLVIDFYSSGKVLDAKYLDESRKKEIISNE